MCKENLNEMEFIKREYELLRFFSSLGDNFSKKANENIKPIVEELLNNEEYLKYAICVNKDRFGVKQLNGVVTAFFMLTNLKEIKPEIADNLLKTLLFECQDDENKTPFALTGKPFIGANYLMYLLDNTEYQLNEQYAKRISELITESQKNVIDFWLITSYFCRNDISIKLKKFVIDSLDEDVLYNLTNVWEESFMSHMLNSFNPEVFNMSDEELKELEKEFENSRSERNASLDEVITLINKKIYS